MEHVLKCEVTYKMTNGEERVEEFNFDLDFSEIATSIQTSDYTDLFTYGDACFEEEFCEQINNLPENSENNLEVGEIELIECYFDEKPVETDTFWEFWSVYGDDASDGDGVIAYLYCQENSEISLEELVGQFSYATEAFAGVYNSVGEYLGELDYNLGDFAEFIDFEEYWKCNLRHDMDRVYYDGVYYFFNRI